MSPKIAIGSVTLALVLAAAVLVVSTSPRRDATQAPTPPRTPLSSLDATRAASLRVEQGPRAWLIWRDPRTDLWLWREGDASAWPAEATAVRGWLRLLQQAGQAPVSVQAQGAAQEQPHERVAAATRVRLTLAGGAELVLSLEPGLGGKATLREEHAGVTHARQVDATLAASLSESSLAQWRSPRLLAEVAGNATSLVIESDARRVELRRTRGAWSLTHPAVAPAQQAKVNEALASLGALASPRLAPQAPTSPSPSMLLRRVSESPAEGGKTPILTETVEVFGPADAQGATRFARVRAEWDDGPAWGPALVVVAVDALGALVAPDPTEFVARAALAIAPADAARLVATHDPKALLADAPPQPTTAPGPRDVVAERAGAAWTMATRGGRANADSDQARALVDMLLATPADEVRLGAWGGGEPEGLARVTLQSSSGAALGAVAIGLVERRDPKSPGGNAAKSWVLVRTGGVTRAYDSDAARSIHAWLKDSLPPEG